MGTLKTADGFELNLYAWEAEKPAATVALLHGYGEHAGRYAHVGEAFKKRGLTTLASDLRGHGRSTGRRGHVERFNDYHLDATALVEEARRRGGPVFLFGHSMGGLLALDWLLAGGGKDLAGLVLSSPYLGLALKVSPAKAALARVMSNLMPTLALPSGLTGKDVAQDPELQRIYDTDPLNNKKATARAYTEGLAAHERVFARVHTLRLPTLLLYGGDDRVAQVSANDRLAAALAMPDKVAERLPGIYHELVNEPPEVRAKLIGRMGEWMASLAARAQRPASGAAVNGAEQRGA